jgi:hypothetical protein
VTLSLDRTCNILLEECGHVRRGEEVLILSDDLQTQEMKRIKKILDAYPFVEISSPKGDSPPYPNGE